MPISEEDIVIVSIPRDMLLSACDQVGAQWQHLPVRMLIRLLLKAEEEQR